MQKMTGKSILAFCVSCFLEIFACGMPKGPEAWLEFMGGSVRKDGLRCGVGALERLHEREGLRSGRDEQFQPLRLRLRVGVAVLGGGRNTPCSGWCPKVGLVEG